MNMRHFWKKTSEFFVDIPKFHKEYPKIRGWPQAAEKYKCQDLLSISHKCATNINGHRIYLESDRYKIDDVVQKRIGVPILPERAGWYLKQRDDGRRNVDHNPWQIDTLCDDLKDISPIYNPQVFHSFSNSPCPLKLTLNQANTHVAIGFCDLRQLTVCEIDTDSVHKPIHIVAIDMSAYAIAKSMVIFQMLKNHSIACQSILEVWYSATWTQLTAKDFNTGVNAALKEMNADCQNQMYDQNHSDTTAKSTQTKFKKNYQSTKKRAAQVGDYLRHWQKSQGKNVAISSAREKWLESQNVGKTTHFNIASLKSVDNIFDMCDYKLTGDILARRNTKPSYGNVTMFDSDNISGSEIQRTQEESVFEVLRYNKQFSNEWQQCDQKLTQTVKSILLKDIKRLKKLVQNKIIEIEFIHGNVVPENKKLIDVIVSKQPTSINWSNCIDYMNKRQFHQIAQQIGVKNCVHHAYSMNWVQFTFGTFVFDYKDSNERKAIINDALKDIQNQWKCNGMYDIMRWTPVDNAVNYGSYSLATDEFYRWANYFRCWSDANINFINFDVIEYSPLLRTSLSIGFAWKYNDTFTE